MIEALLPGSSSAIVKASHLFLVHVIAAHPGPWAPDLPPTEKRLVELSLRLERIFKGSTDRKPGDAISVEVEQWRSAISRQFALPGPWSGKSLEPGAEHLVFVEGEGPVQALLRQPALVLSPPEALADVQLVDVAESERLSLGVLLERARAEAPRLGYLFPEYIFELHGAALMASRQEFESLARLLEEPALAPIARNTLLKMCGAAMDQGRVSPAVEDRYVRALFHLLELLEAAPFADNIARVYLPNRTGRRRASVVFRGAPAEKKRAQQALAERAGPQAESLRAWLAAEPEKLK